MNNLSELKSYDTLRKASEILGVRLPMVFTPVEENYITGKHGPIGTGINSECRARLYLFEIGRDKEWSLPDTLDRMVGAMSDRGRSEALELIEEWKDSNRED